jgi:coenzyme F420-reducing hydrogenase gamma subunit
MAEREKKRIAIYDFTDCEGCEVRLCSLKERLLDVSSRFEIVNWRLGQEACEDGPYDIVIIEGTPVTGSEIALLRELRSKTALLVSLGACASIGGIPGIMDRAERKKWYERIYGPGYCPVGVDTLPLSAYVQVDYLIHGCPVDEDELVRVFEELASGKAPLYRGYSVCFECRQAGNECRIIDGKICFGPITQGGCKAVCVSGGSACYGCFGYRDEGNIEGLVRVLRAFASPAGIRQHLAMFFNQVPEYKEAFERALKKRPRRGKAATKARQRR